MFLSLVALIAVHSPSQAVPVFAPVHEFAIDGLAIHLHFGDNGTRIHVGTLNGQYAVWDMRAKRFVKEWYVGREIRKYVPSSGGRVFTLHADGSVALRSGENGEVVRELHFGDEGKYGKRGVVTLFQGPDAGCIVAIRDGRDPARPYYEYVYVASDGRIRSRTRTLAFVPYYVAPTVVACWQSEQTIAFYDPISGKRLRTLTVHTGSLYYSQLTFSSDQKLIAVIPYQRPVSIISARTGKEVVRTAEWHKVGEVLFSNNSKSFLIMAESQPALYRVADGKEVARLRARPRGTGCFAPDDGLVAIGHREPQTPKHYIRVFEVPRLTTHANQRDVDVSQWETHTGGATMPVDLRLVASPTATPIDG